MSKEPENADASGLTLFSLEDPLYDLGTFWGRYQKLRGASDIRYAFITEQKVLEQKALLDK